MATAAPETAEAEATSAPDSFSASRLDLEAARARTEELFRCHGHLVVGLCRGLLRNAHDAEDAAQQAFLSAHAAFIRGAQPDDPARWLTAIARNECLARIRERMRHPLPVSDTDETASTSDPVSEAARRADMRALWRAVGALAPQQREALLLREFGGLSYDELAVALGVSVPSVESLLFRARARLRLELRTAASALAGLLPRLLAGGGVVKVAGATVAAGLLTGGVVAGEHMATRTHAPATRAAAVPELVSPLSDLPVGRAPTRLPRRVRVAPPAPHRTRPASPASTPAATTSSTRPPVPLADSTKQHPGTPSNDGTANAQPTSSGTAPSPAIVTGDSSAPTLTTEQSSSDDGMTAAPTSSGDGSGDTTATTPTSDGGGPDGGSSGSNDTGTDGGS